MTVHASRLPAGLAAGIAEAKGRMRGRRSFLALGLMLAGLAVGLTFALRSPAGGPVVSRPLTSSVNAAGVRVSVPRGFSTYPIRGSGPGRISGRPPLIGHGLADFAVPAHVSIYGVFDKWAALDGSGPPANVVALQISLNVNPGPDPATLLHLPLTLSQPWFHEKLSKGKVGYRWGSLFTNGEVYNLFYWSGSEAPANDRVAILRALESIRPAR
jgi:hypothetical protein